ncbi:MAG: hypothetical protein NVS4B6_20680 [Mycobacterium sp.]
MVLEVADHRRRFRPVDRIAKRCHQICQTGSAPVGATTPAQRIAVDRCRADAARAPRLMHDVAHAVEATP